MTKTIGEAVKAKETTNTNLVVYILLDRSGSMGHGNLWAKTLEGINTYVRALPVGTHVHLAAFDSGPQAGFMLGQPFNGLAPGYNAQDQLRYTVMRDAAMGDNWRDLTPFEVSPHGGTPLIDATVQLFEHALNRTPEGYKAAFVIVTDGAENASKRHTASDVKRRMELAATRGWETVYLGANFEGVERQAVNIGVNIANAVHYSAHKTEAVWNDLATRTASYSRGLADNFAYNSMEKASMTTAGEDIVKHTVVDSAA